MESVRSTTVFLSLASAVALVLSAVFLREPARDALCGLATFQRFPACSLFDADRLARHDGADGRKIYLSILGTVFDVTDGRRFYGPGGSYHGFAGRDASRSFITGLFKEEDLSDNVIDLNPNDLIGLDTWLSTYRKKYKEIGKLIGRYYDTSGKETDYCKTVYEKIESSKVAKVAKKQETDRYPGCNVQYIAESQKSKIWCTTLSGGVKRDWTGVPRKLQTLDENGNLSVRCACVRPDKLSDAELAHVIEYEDCNADSISCHVDIN